jgi:hypothetical protein
MIDDRQSQTRLDRRWVWCGLIALLGAAASWISVPTTLGVQVPETAISGIDPSLVDTSGHERIWRVWWRARGEFIELDHQWLVTAGLIVLLAVFAIGTMAAIWIALTPGSESFEVTDTNE